MGHKLTTAGAGGALVAVALAACGSSGSKPPCMVLSNGNQLCGNAAVAWCELNNVALDTTDYPLDSPTHQACVAASNWADRGQKVINVSPSSNGTGLNETTTAAP